MASRRVGKKSAVFLVVLSLLCTEAVASIEINAPSGGVQSRIRFTDGADWVQYTWFMPGLGIDPELIVVVHDSEGGLWQPQQGFVQWLLNEPPGHSDRRDAAVAGNSSASGLLTDLVGGGSNWLDFRTTHGPSISTSLWETFYSTLQPGGEGEGTPLGQVRELIGAAIAALGQVVVVAFGGYMAWRVLRAALEWARIISPSVSSPSYRWRSGGGKLDAEQQANVRRYNAWARRNGKPIFRTKHTRESSLSVDRSYDEYLKANKIKRGKGRPKNYDGPISF